MTERELRGLVREELLSEYGTDSDPGRATAASGGKTHWFQVARLVDDLARERREVEDLGKTDRGHGIRIGNHEYIIAEA